MPKLSNDLSKPVPGGSGQRVKGTTVPKFVGASSSGGNTGSKRGIVGSGTIDRHGRTPAQQARNPVGNYGGGYARRDGSLPRNANRKG